LPVTWFLQVAAEDADTNKSEATVAMMMARMVSSFRVTNACTHRPVLASSTPRRMA
jgi:hypothetical protein